MKNVTGENRKAWEIAVSLYILIFLQLETVRKRERDGGKGET